MNKKMFDIDTDLINPNPRFKMPTAAKVILALFVYIPILLGLLCVIILFFDLMKYGWQH